MDFLVIDGDKTLRDATCLLIESEGHHAQPLATGEAALTMLKEDKFDAVLLDLKLGLERGLEVLEQMIELYPHLPVVMFTDQDTVNLAVEAIRRGALDFLEKPFTYQQMQTVLARLQRFRQLSNNIEKLELEINETQFQNPELLLDFETPGMQAVMDVLLRAAKTPASILITGESGTGKSILARTVHMQGNLASKPFVTVSCPSLSKELLESELFGHVKGSFTGAIKDHWGKVKAAEGGTLFLDEIGDLPLEIQPKLLRFLQEHEYERVGENITRKSKLRIIAATNRDLRKRMVEGAFREDLYYRLNVISVAMPPLRQRPGDLLRLANHYLDYFSKKYRGNLSVFSDAAITRLLGHSWPGNLRELRNTIERAAILEKNDAIGIENMPEDANMPKDVNGNQPIGDIPVIPGGMVSLQQIEDLHIRRVMERTATVSEAANILGIDQATIYRKRKKMGIIPIGQFALVGGNQSSSTARGQSEIRLVG